MAHMLVESKRFRTKSINIRRSDALQRDSKLSISRSVDEILYLPQSHQLLNLLTRFASESQISKYKTQPMNSTCKISQSLSHFNLPLTLSNSTSIKSNDHDDVDINCDTIELVSIDSTDDFYCSHKENIEALCEKTIDNKLDLKSQAVNEDILLDISPTINNDDNHSERPVRRRRRRSSLTKTSISHDDVQPTTNPIEQIESKENVELKPNDESQGTNTTEKIDLQHEDVDQESHNEEVSAPVSRYRGRKLRQRLYRQAASLAISQDTNSKISSEIELINESLNIDPPRLNLITQSSPLSSPVSPTLSIASHQSNSSKSITCLKHINSIGRTKKNVRFADSVGRELTQIQYIRSSLHDEPFKIPFLLDSFLSSSPPTYGKNSLYISNNSSLEHKPWSLFVSSSPNKQIYEPKLNRRFFCLFRQPNSEHPDIYLHEIWKSQIKLEYADISSKQSSSSEQQLVGTLWVTNAAYCKYVSVKYTFTRWLNTYEREAQFRSHSNDYRNIDQFEFKIDVPIGIDQLDFVLRYCVNGEEYWDNNDGKNYTLKTESTYAPSTIISLPHDCDFNEMRFY